MTEQKPDGLSQLREPFPANQISKLPKQMQRGDQDKGRCEKGSRYSADGYYCGGWHARSIHLDYVGHAAITDRLLNVDPGWTWEPVAFGQDGLPALDADGGLWIRLTVCGVTRLGYGDAQGKTGGDAMKERIGDALRNAAMRFGAALDLWHKGDLHSGENEPPPEPPDAALVDLKRQVWETAKASGVESADHLAHDFASRMDGLVLADASADELAAYLALLQHEASLREAS